MLFLQPVQESLAAEHTGVVLGDALEHLLDGGGVTKEGDGHLQTLGGDIADGGLDVAGDPLDEVGRVLVLDVQHLLIDLLGGHASTEEGGGGEVATVTGIGGAHHVLGVEHLLGEFGNGEGAVLLGATASQGRETGHEEMETGERNHVDGDLAEIAIELTGETEAASGTGEGGGDEMVQITVGRGGELESSEADIVQSLVVHHEGLIGVLDKLMETQDSVVGLNNGVRHLGGWDDGESSHHAVGVLLTDLGDQKRTHTGTSTATERVAELEALQAIAAFSLLADNIQNGVNQLSTLSVVTLGPIVTGSGLTEDEIVGAEELTERTGADRILRKYEI